MEYKMKCILVGAAFLAVSILSSYYLTTKEIMILQLCLFTAIAGFSFLVRASLEG